MLSIGKLGKGQESYYLEKVAEGAEDYYSGEGEEAGQWLGDAARELGLSGEVEPDQLVAMLTGNNPATGDPLGLVAVSGKGPVPASISPSPRRSRSRSPGRSAVPRPPLRSRPPTGARSKSP